MKIFNISEEIQEIINEIDISDSNYEKALKRYESISKYIDDSSLSEYGPDIYLQGSIKLGTAIKLLTEEIV